MNSETGKQMRSQRPIEVESVFGDIKGNYGVRRFLPRGLDKVGIEWGLYSMGHDEENDNSAGVTPAFLFKPVYQLMFL